MKRNLSRGPIWNYIVFLFFLLLSGVQALSQIPLPKGAMTAGESAADKSSIKTLPNGIRLSRGKMILQVEALRDDVLRVRTSVKGEFAEDASWAIPEQIRHQAAQVVADSSSDAIGFHTKSLRVRIDRDSLRLTVSDLQGNILQEDAPNWPIESHGPAFRVYKTMPVDEHYFGLGDKVGPLDRRGQTFRLWNTDKFGFQESTDPIYKAIPFFLTMRAGRSLGVLLDNTWATSFDFGRLQRNTYSFGSEGGPIDYYLFYGPDPKHVVMAYAWLTGLPPLPPLWSLGFQQSRYSYESEEKVRQIGARLRADKIPADVLYLDIDFQDRNRPFTVDKKQFPHFTQMLSDLKRDNFHVVAITDLHIAQAPNEGYSPYDSGAAGDHFVKLPNGSAYIGKVWPGPAVFPEFTQQQSRAWWGELYKEFASQGVAGFWNDMNEPSIFDVPSQTMPDDVQHRINEPGFKKRTATHLEIHNVYGMENSRATYEGLLRINPKVRPFVLTRASYAGGQRYAATWTGDNTGSWNHLRLSTPMLLNLGLSGFGLCGADVGGFTGTPSPELLTRWTELATFQPIDRNHTDKGSAAKEIWVHGPEQEAIRRRYIEERYRLLPYIYTLAEELSRTGLPMVRPLFLEFPDAAKDLHPLDLDAGNEFLFGRSLLVAPEPFGEQPSAYQVTLPPGGWFDYWSGAKIVSGDSAGRTIQPKLDTLPVFVREGTILPMQPLTQSTGETPQGPLTLRVYPGKDCKGSLYLDDGKTMAYKQDDYLRIEFSCAVTSDGVSVHVGEHQGKFHRWWKQIHLEIYGWDSPAAQYRLGGAENSSLPSIDSSRHVLTLDLPDEAQARDLEIRSSH